MALRRKMNRVDAANWFSAGFSFLIHRVLCAPRRLMPDTGQNQRSIVVNHQEMETGISRISTMQDWPTSALRRLRYSEILDCSLPATLS